jgi:membrane fusion protein, multidrug efflux system
MPGGYAAIHLQVPAAAGVLSIPASALIFNAHGLSVATVGADNHVVIKPVTIARDLGTVVEVASGLVPEDRAIENPPDGIAAGDQVRVARKK